jgi:hypothetical protein
MTNWMTCIWLGIFFGDVWSGLVSCLTPPLITPSIFEDDVDEGTGDEVENGGL